jgi:glyoxylase-like metal-dependent hydrolase (beta-lactamase superfamily II)
MGADPTEPPAPAPTAGAEEKPRYRRQEQEPASEEVSEVAPGVLRLQLPIEFTGLGHVNTYALTDSKGVALVDVGMPGNATWDALGARLKTAGLRLRDVHTVVVTHSHPDHFGAAGRLVHDVGAQLITERRFQTWFDPQHHHTDARDTAAGGPAGDGGDDAGDDAGDGAGPAPDDTGYVDVFSGTPWGGAPLPRQRGQRVMVFAARHGLLRRFRPPVPTRRVVSGERVSLGGRQWTCVHTPGHTRDHLCLLDPESGVLMSGDHVLPSITPHVSGVTGAADALADYLASLDALRHIGPVTTVLPAHGHPFHNLEQRLGEIEEHHQERLAEIRKIAGEEGALSVVEFSRRMFRKSHWGLMAESETYAHLEHLRLGGKAERFERDGLLWYEVGSTA